MSKPTPVDSAARSKAPDLSIEPGLHRDYPFYQKAVLGERLPLAFLDLDLLDANALALTARAAGLPMRLATKSLRCLEVIKYLLARYPSFRGVMAFSAAEAAWLSTQGINDILIGYPTLEVEEIRPCLEALRSGHRLCFMVDHVTHINMLEALAAKAGVTVPLCLDIDLSTAFPGLHFGVYRSPLRSARDAAPLLDLIAKSRHLRLEGVMGYEAQLAGVADALPGSPFYNVFLRFLKRLSRRECFARRQGLVREITDRGLALRFVNGGGTGSIESTRLDPSVTELTVGSGLYSPSLFDHYQAFHHLPAAGFALPVVREARPGIYACAGGGYVASGPSNIDKQPIPYLPAGVEIIKMLGAGEVQTSLRSPNPLPLGAPVFFRHAKAGELCERFNSLYLLRGGRIKEVAPTYRGQGQCFF